MSDIFSGASAKDFLSNTDTVIATSKNINKEMMRQSKIKPFIATNENDRTSIVSVTLKTSEVGSHVNVSMEDVLTGSGSTGNVDFSASQEQLKDIKMLVVIDRFQHSVPSDESIVNTRRAVKFKARAKTSLTNWATMKFDKIYFSVNTANATNILACGHHGDKVTTNILKADVLTTSDVDEAKNRALLGIDAEGKEVPPLMPVKILKNENLGFYDDIKIFIMFVGTHSAMHITKDPNWEEARKLAALRAKDNPIFTGALGLHNGVLLLNVETDTARQSGILTSKSKFNGFGNVKSFDLTTYAGAAGQETEINLMVGACSTQMVLDEGIAYYEWPDAKDPRYMHAGIDRVCGLAKTKYNADQNDGLLAGTMFDGKDFGVIAVVASTGR